MFHKRADGTYVFTRRFWVTAFIAGTLICLIGFSTQRTANRTDALSEETRAYANQTNECLVQVIDVLTTRVGYNDEIAKLDSRRQQVWENLVTDLSLGEGSAELNRAALSRFFQANQAIKDDQAKIAKLREENQYPNCPKQLAQARP